MRFPSVCSRLGPRSRPARSRDLHAAAPPRSDADRRGPQAARAGGGMSGEAVEAGAFDARYSAEPDPWGYETSSYEQEKFERTLASLPARWGRGLEMGCSNGEL